MRTRPLRDLVRITIWSSIAVPLPSIGRLQEALVLALQFLFEHDAPDCGTAVHETIGGTQVRAIHVSVVCELPRLADARIERCRLVFVWCAPSAFEQVATAVG